MKDYYTILQVTKSSTDDEIRKNYRKLAMQYHPDRNPNDTQAEERFKEIAEAYGVLTDEVKRREYDRLRVNGRNAFPGSGNSEGFSYSQEDILRDLFKDPRFQHMFKGLLHEFQRSGFRANSTFIKNSFFHGKKGIFFGGVFLFGSLAKPMLTQVARKGLSGNSSLLKSVTSTVGSLLGFGQRSKNASQTNSPRPKQIKEFDTTYHTPLSENEFKHGKIIQVVVYGDKGEQTLKVTIPPASREGQRLRIKGKGRSGPLGRGDLYLNLVRQ